MSIYRNVRSLVSGLIPYSIKYGPDYKKYTNLLKESEYWPSKQHEAYQFNKLLELVKYANEHIPFYKDYFEQNNLNTRDFTSLLDIEKLPIVDKDLFISQGNNFVSDEFDIRKMTYSTTGGTTGQQLRFYAGRKRYNSREMPFVNHIWKRVGFVRERSRVVQMRAAVFPKDNLWKYSFAERALVINTYKMTDDNIGKILNKITEWKAEYIHTYPSIMLVLCDYIIQNNIDFKSSLKAILVTSENLYPGQKEKIEKCLGARCFTFYGHSEVAVIAGWCEESDLYHIEPEYGIFELIDEDGNIITEPDKIGEIVCTGFDNFVMPFIRYKTGDYASYSKKTDCKCGRHLKLLNDVQGRWAQEMFVCAGGKKVAMAAINMHSDIFKNVKNYQFYQNKEGECTIRIIKNSEYELADEETIKGALMEKFGKDSMKLQFEYVDSIERTVRGKWRFIIQDL